MKKADVSKIQDENIKQILGEHPWVVGAVQVDKEVYMVMALDVKTNRQRLIAVASAVKEGAMHQSNLIMADPEIEKMRPNKKKLPQAQTATENAALKAANLQQGELLEQGQKVNEDQADEIAELKIKLEEKMEAFDTAGNKAQSATKTTGDGTGEGLPEIQYPQKPATGKQTKSGK